MYDTDIANFLLMKRLATRFVELTIVSSFVLVRITVLV